MINILLFEDNVTFSKGIKRLFSLSDGYNCIAHLETGEFAVKQVQEHNPDVILMDIDMPKKNGVQAVREIREHNITTPIIMLTVFEDDDNIMQALYAGADGYLLKEATPKRILTAIEDVLEGGAPMSAYVARRLLKLFRDNEKESKQETGYNLSSREKEILKLLCDGFSYKMIASQLAISYHTVNNHIKRIYDKLQVHSSIEAVTKAAKERLI